MSRTKIVAGNWKMYKTQDEAMATLKALSEGLASSTVQNTEVWIAPSFVLLPALINHFSNTIIQFGAQDCSAHAEGAYTGEVSSAMLKSIGAKFAILGHSERRAYHGETDTLINKKIEAVLSNALTPVYCCGETLTERQAERHIEVVRTQVTEALFSLNADAMSRIVIAYEPVWAIGTGVTASPEQAQEMHACIRDVIRGHFGDAIADHMRILYGGSVKPGNAAELFAKPDIDGGLVGGASLVAGDLLGIIHAA